MAKQTQYYLSDEDREVLARLIENERARLRNNPGDEQYARYNSPDVYVVRPAEEGAPFAAATNDFIDPEPAGGPEREYVFGKTTCHIFKPEKKTGSEDVVLVPVMRPDGAGNPEVEVELEGVLNQSLVAIPYGYATAKRNKHGYWVLEEQASRSAVGMVRGFGMEGALQFRQPSDAPAQNIGSGATNSRVWKVAVTLVQVMEQDPAYSTTALNVIDSDEADGVLDYLITEQKDEEGDPTGVYDVETVQAYWIGPLRLPKDTLVNLVQPSPSAEWMITGPAACPYLPVNAVAKGFPGEGGTGELYLTYDLTDPADDAWHRFSVQRTSGNSTSILGGHYGGHDIQPPDFSNLDEHNSHLAFADWHSNEGYYPSENGGDDLYIMSYCELMLVWALRFDANPPSFSEDFTVTGGAGGTVAIPHRANFDGLFVLDAIQDGFNVVPKEVPEILMHESTIIYHTLYAPERAGKNTSAHHRIDIAGINYISINHIKTLPVRLDFFLQTATSSSVNTGIVKAQRIELELMFIPIGNGLSSNRRRWSGRGQYFTDLGTDVLV